MALNPRAFIYLTVVTSALLSPTLGIKSCDQKKIDHWIKYTSILAVVGWGLFVILTVGLLLGLCNVKQRRVRAENELFNLRTISRHRMLVMPDHKAEQTITTIPSNPAVAPTNNVTGGGAGNRPYVNSGGTSYYPPTSTAFECQGERWTPAPSKIMPSF